MRAAVGVLGAAAQAVAWWLVAFRGADLWRVTVPVLAAAGALALVAGPPPLAPEVGWPAAAAAGVGAGIVLYGATAGFVRVARSWTAFLRHVRSLYRWGEGRPLAWALGLSVLIGVPGEELFWRGLVQHEVAGTELGASQAAALAWLGYVVVNLPSANLAVVAAAVVGGAAWGALAWWTGGTLAPVASHVVWTAMMIAVPVVGPEADR